VVLDFQVENYFEDIRSEDAFSKFEGISSGDKIKKIKYLLIYLLLARVIFYIAYLATAIADIVFSVMKIIKMSCKIV
jgi:hypothetical protein